MLPPEDVCHPDDWDKIRTPRALSGSDTGRMESFRLDLKDKFAPLITDMISSKVSPDFTSTFLLQEEAAVTHTFLFTLFVRRSVYSILVTSAAGFGSFFCSRTKGPDPAEGERLLKV